MTPELAMSRVYTDFADLAKLRAAAGTQQSSALHAVAQEFEAVFVQMMLKSMRDTQLQDGIMDSDATRMYQDMFDKQVALDMAKRGEIGVGQMIVDQFADSGQMPAATPGIAGFGPSAQSLFNASRLSDGMEEAGAPPDRAEALARIKAMRPSSLPVTDEPLRFKTPEQFVEYMRPYAADAAERIGVDPDLLIAQAALETGWGRKVIRRADGSSSFNLFGIKADRRWQGDRVRVASLEFENGVAVKQVSPFRAYSSYGESFHDYVDFVSRNKRYSDALLNAEDPRAYINELHKAGYATDPKYAKKIMSILRRDVFNEPTIFGA